MNSKKRLASGESKSDNKSIADDDEIVKKNKHAKLILEEIEEARNTVPVERLNKVIRSSVAEALAVTPRNVRLDFNFSTDNISKKELREMQRTAASLFEPNTMTFSMTKEQVQLHVYQLFLNGMSAYTNEGWASFFGEGTLINTDGATRIVGFTLLIQPNAKFFITFIQTVAGIKEFKPKKTAATSTIKLVNGKEVKEIKLKREN